MFFGKPMRCGDAGVIFYSPRVPVHWIRVQRDFLSFVFLSLLRNPCVFDGLYGAHFLSTAGTVQSFISYLHKRTGRPLWCEVRKHQCVKVNVCVSTSYCVFHCAVHACLYICLSLHFSLQILSICDQSW